MSIPVDSVLLWALVFTRLGALLGFLPAIGERSIPIRIRVALAGLTSLVFVPLLPPTDAIALNASYLVVLFLKELSVGVLMGLAARMTFYLVDLAGRIIAQEAGLARLDSFDPISQTQSTALTVLYFNLAAVAMMSLGIHHEIIAACVRSFHLVPIGNVWPAPFGVETFVRTTNDLFEIAVRMAGPVIAVNLVINLTFAVLGKAAPKINVFITSFAVRVLAGLWLLGATVGLIASYIVGSLQDAPLRMLHFLGL
ncbi:MAG: flagellar biosynthetic protein FliR [Opitutales bacterium]